MPVPVDPTPDFVINTPAVADQVDARFKTLYDTLNPAVIGLDASNTKPAFAKDNVEPAFSGWRRYGEILGGSWIPGGGNNTFLLFRLLGSTPPFVAQAGSIQSAIPQLDPADYAAGSRSVKFRIKQVIYVNAVAPGQNFATWMARIATRAASSGSSMSVATINPEQLGLISVTAPAANSRTPNTSAEFSLPAADDYIVACQFNTLPAGCTITVLTELQYRQT